MSRRLDNNDADAIVELCEADLAVVQGGTGVLRWLPPSFPIREPVPAPLWDPYPGLTRPDAGPRPNPLLDVVVDLRATLEIAALAR